jgi:hypothetical protein
MAELLGSRLRAACRSGLTSPDPVRTSTPARASRCKPRPRRTPDKPQNRQRKGKHALKSLAEPRNRNEFSRWIEA